MIVLLILISFALAVLIGSAMTANRKSREQMEFYHPEIRKLNK